MKLKELYEIVNYYGEHASGRYDDVEVVIKIKGESFGVSPHVKVAFAGKGIDWDANLFLICPEKGFELSCDSQQKE